MAGAAGSPAITTVETCHTASAWRSAAYCAALPAGSGNATPNPSREMTRNPGAAVPARHATPSGPPPPAWL